MPINYARLRSVTAREVISALIRDGFSFDRGAGSHHLYSHPDGRRVTVTFHSGHDTFRFKTLKSMMEHQAKWTEDELIRLGLFPEMNSPAPLNISDPSPPHPFFELDFPPAII